MAAKKEGKSKAKPKPKSTTVKTANIDLKESVTKKKLGRPTKYTPELAELICKRIATHALGLKHICAMYEDMPCKDTVNEWRWVHESFSVMYVKAKQLQAETIVDELMEIATDGSNDWMEYLEEKDDTTMGWKLNGEHVQRSRLRIDTGKWLAAKLAPRIYGEKNITENHNFNHEKSLKDLDE